jgi:formylmethanofuran dehydrogenase subunit E
LEYPNFFNDVEPFILKDELSEFLGATKDGIIEINYIDCVKLAGHSCPTVAGAYILTKVALERLFNNQMPIRSSLKITIGGAKEEGVNGVIANVISFITGCNDEGGFSGIGGKFNKKNLLSFNPNQKELVKFSTLDNLQEIRLNLDTSIVPGNPKMQILMQKQMQNIATEDEIKEFRTLWQDRVKFMLLNKNLWNKIAKEI